MLADPKLSVAEKYGACSEKTRAGRKTKAVDRKTFVLDDKKRVVKVFSRVSPEKHAKRILSFIEKEIKEGSA